MTSYFREIVVFVAVLFLAITCNYAVKPEGCELYSL